MNDLHFIAHHQKQQSGTNVSFFKKNSLGFLIADASHRFIGARDRCSASHSIYSLPRGRRVYDRAVRATRRRTVQSVPVTRAQPLNQSTTMSYGIQYAWNKSADSAFVQTATAQHLASGLCAEPRALLCVICAIYLAEGCVCAAS